MNRNERTERSNSRSFSFDREASCCRPATMLYVGSVRGKINPHTHIGSDLCSFRIKPFERVQIVERDWVKSNSSLYEKKNWNR